MSRDPYHDFASDLKSSLSSARSLSQSYRQLVSRSQAHASSSSSATNSGNVESAHDRLSDAIEGLRQDVEDVKQSVLVVERSGPERFGVSPEELRSRKAFVAECEAEVKVRSLHNRSCQRGRKAGMLTLYDEFANRHCRKWSKMHHRAEEPDSTRSRSTSMTQTRMQQKHSSANSSRYVSVSPTSSHTVSILSDPIALHQQMLMSRQDSTLDKIGSTLSSLRNQAGMMGQEIGEQIEIIDAFDSEVDQSQGRLGKAMSKMDEVVRISDERLGGWCVWILVVILFLLLLVVLLI